ELRIETQLIQGGDADVGARGLVNLAGVHRAHLRRGIDHEYAERRLRLGETRHRREDLFLGETGGQSLDHRFPELRGHGRLQRGAPRTRFDVDTGTGTNDHVAGSAEVTV